MQIALESIIKRSNNYDEKVWGISTDTKLSIEYELINHIENTRLLYHDFLAKFANMINEVNLI